jgi:hypothetical protein
MAKKSKMGRPPLPPGLGKSFMLRVRVTEAEIKHLKALAARAGVTVSDILMRPFRKG